MIRRGVLFAFLWAGAVAHVARDHVYPAINMCLPAACSGLLLAEESILMQRIVFSCAGTDFNGHGLHMSALAIQQCQTAAGF